MGSQEHWEAIYGKKGPQDVSWYRPHLDRSLLFIDQAALSPDAAIIDVGRGASTLVDDLLARGTFVEATRPERKMAGKPPCI